MELNLQDFCAPTNEPRSYLHKPFPTKYGAAACDGALLVVKTGTHCEPVADPHVLRIVSQLESWLDARGSDEWVTITAEQVPSFPREECFACKGAGKSRKESCACCNGEGEFTHLGYDYECKPCEGAGDIYVADEQTTCPICGGRGEWWGRDTDLSIGGVLFNACYLYQLTKIPGFQIAPNGPDGKAKIRFDGGIGLLMPMRPPASPACNLKEYVK